MGEGEAPFWEGPDEWTPIGIGTRYLAMAIVNKKQGIPVLFQIIFKLCDYKLLSCN